MARQPGEHPLSRAARLREPVAVPTKDKTLRYWSARSRNGWRRWRRIRYRSAESIRNSSDWLGATYRCKVCGRDVLLRRAERHNWEHKQAGETIANQGRPRTKTVGEAAAEKDLAPAPRKPSKAKAAAVAKVKAAPLKDNPDLVRVAPISKITNAKPDQRRWPQVAQDLEDDMAARPRRSGNSETSSNGTGTPGVPSSSAAGALVNAVKAWCEYEPTTVTELRAHLLGMDAALGVVADHFHEFAAQKIVAKRIHPAVAQPIDSAGDEFASLRHRFSEAYARFEAIYAERLAYERSATPKPDEKMFKDVS